MVTVNRWSRPRSPIQSGASTPGSKAASNVCTPDVPRGAAWPVKWNATIDPASNRPSTGAPCHAGMERPPALIRWKFEWPCELLANASGRIEYLIAQSCRIEGGLDAMQILDLLRHSVRGSRTGCRDLQHAAMHLHIEGQDMTADISEDIVRHQQIPELLGMLRTDLANIRA